MCIASISHLAVLSAITQQKEFIQSSSHTNYVYVIFKSEEQVTV